MHAENVESVIAVDVYSSGGMHIELHQKAFVCTSKNRIDTEICLCVVWMQEGKTPSKSSP